MSLSAPQQQRTKKRSSKIAAFPEEDDIDKKVGLLVLTSTTAITISTGGNRSSTVNANNGKNENSSNHFQHVLRPRKKQNRSSSLSQNAQLHTTVTVPTQAKSTRSQTTFQKKGKKKYEAVVPPSTGTLKTVERTTTTRRPAADHPPKHPDVRSRTSPIRTRSKTSSTPTQPIALPVVTPRHMTATTMRSTSTDGNAIAPSHSRDKKSTKDDDDDDTHFIFKHYYDRDIAVDRTEPPPGVINIFPEESKTPTRRTTHSNEAHSPHPPRASVLHRGDLIARYSSNYITTYGLEYLFLLIQQQNEQFSMDDRVRERQRHLIAVTRSRNLPPPGDDCNVDTDENSRYHSNIETQKLSVGSKDDDDDDDDEEHTPVRTDVKGGSDNGDDIENTRIEVDHDVDQTTHPRTPERQFNRLSPLTMEDDNIQNGPCLMSTPVDANAKSRPLPGSQDSALTSTKQQERQPPQIPTVTILNQPLLTAKMRRTLVLWLSEVCQEFHLSDATYHLAVTLLDQTLVYNRFPIRREQFQAIGCVCLWIASKMEDVKAPSRHDLCYISDYSVSNGQLLRLEQHICNLLQFRLQYVTPYHLVPIFLRASAADDSTAPSRTVNGCDPIDVPIVSMVKYLLELSRASYRLSQERPDLLAASSVYLARATLGIVGKGKNKRTQPNDLYWTKTLKHYTTYDTTDMVDTIIKIYELQIAAESASSKGVGGCPAYKKYGTRNHHCVSLKAPPRLEDLGLPNLDMDYDNFIEPCLK